MLDASIPLSIKNLDAGSAINTFDNAQNQAMNLRSLAQQQDMRNEQLKASRMQNSEELRKQQEDKSIRGIMQVNDTTTPEGQQQALQDLQTVGLGHRAQEYAAQFSAQSAARQKALDDRAAAKLKFQSDTSDLQKKIEVAHNEFMAKAAGTVLSLPPEQRQDYWSHIKQGALDNHIDAGDMPDQVPQDENLLKHLSRVNLSPDKQAELAQGDQFNSLKPELDRIMTPPKGGWDPTKGEKATALATAILKIPATLLSSPAGKEWVTAQKGEPQTTVLNPMMGDYLTTKTQITAENRLAKANENQTKDYEVTKRGALAFKADYENYKNILASGDKQAIKVAQQGMVDKYITTSTGKSTGDAQFKNFLEGQGIVNAAQNLGDKWKNGSMSTEQVFDAMNDITMSTAMKMNEKVKQSNEMTKKQVEKENKAHRFNIDPDALITHPGDMLSQDSAAFSVGKKSPKTAITTKSGKTFHIEAE